MRCHQLRPKFCGISRWFSTCTFEILGFPVATHKTEEPAPELTFLCIFIDTNKFQLRLPADKLSRLRLMVSAWQYLPKTLLSLLAWLYRVVRDEGIEMNFVDKKDVRFRSLHKTLDSVLHSQGVLSDLIHFKMLWCWPQVYIKTFLLSKYIYDFVFWLCSVEFCVSEKVATTNEDEDIDCHNNRYSKIFGKYFVGLAMHYGWNCFKIGILIWIKRCHILKMLQTIKFVETALKNIFNDDDGFLSLVSWGISCVR